jgi:hypothetical protein
MRIAPLSPYPNLDFSPRSSVPRPSSYALVAPLPPGGPGGIGSPCARRKLFYGRRVLGYFS